VSRQAPVAPDRFSFGFIARGDTAYLVRSLVLPLLASLLGDRLLVPLGCCWPR
jgi:hypothetical protein